MPVVTTRPAITPETPYRPWTYRTIGVEVEFPHAGTQGRICGDDVNRAITRAIRDIPGKHQVRGDGGRYHHSNGTTWDVKKDATCGLEVGTPAFFLGPDGDNPELRAGVEAIKALGAQVNNDCGLHVWVDCSDFQADDLRRLLALWTRYEPFFYSIQPRNRWAHTYCKALRQSTWMGETGSHWDSIQAAITAPSDFALQNACTDVGKYVSLKTSDWWVHGRVEFRIGAGTVEYEDIRCWVMLLTAVVERARNHREGWTQIPATVPSQRNVEYGFTYAHMFKLLGIKSDSRRLNERTVAPEATPVRDWARERILRHAMPTLATRGVSSPSQRPHRVRTRPASPVPDFHPNDAGF